MKKEKETTGVTCYPPMVGPMNLFGLATIDFAGSADIPMVPAKGLLDPLDEDVIPHD